MRIELESEMPMSEREFLFRGRRVWRIIFPKVSRIQPLVLVLDIDSFGDLFFPIIDHRGPSKTLFRGPAAVPHLTCYRAHAQNGDRVRQFQRLWYSVPRRPGLM